MKFLFVLLLFTSSVSAFQPKPPAATKLKKEVEDLVSRLASLPIEMEADGILLLLDAGQIPPDHAPALLDRLFVDSGRVVIKSQLIGLYPEYQDTDGSIPAVVASGSRLGLNQPSLQTRILARFRSLDLKHTISLFDRISLPSASRSCGDSLSPAFDAYYQSLLPLYSDLVKKADKKQREAATDWLFGHLSVRQDSQIAPVADALRKLPAERAELEFGIGRLAQDLTNLNPSYLPYINSLEKTTDALVALSKSASLVGVSPTPLWRAFATYNRNALKGSQCMAFPKDKLNASIELVRTKTLSVALPDDIATEFAGLTLIVPGSMDDAKPQDKRFLAEPRLMELWSDYAKLRFGPKERAQGFRGKSRPDGVTEFLPFEERQSMEWNESASKFLRKVEEFAKRSESDSDPVTAYHNISGLYSSLLEILPMSSNSYPTALSSFIAYISGSPTMRQNTAVWLWRVKIFLRRGSIDESEESFKRIRAAIREQGNQALNTLLDFDRFYPNRSEKNINVIVVP